MATDGDQPTLSEVHQAVRNLYGEREESRRAEADLARWGANALGPLAELARKENDRSLDWRLVCAIQKTGIPEHVELLVDVLDGHTRIDAAHALRLLGDADVWRASADPRFKSAVFRFATTDNPIDQMMFARIAAELDWQDAIPHVEAMLKGHHSLRPEAAGALERLTGRKVDYEKPERRFPAERLVSGLLRRLRELPGPAGQWAGIGERNGKAILVETTDSSSRLLDSELQELGGFALECAPQELLHLGAGNGWLAVTDASNAGRALGLDEEGSTRWTYPASRFGISGIAPLFGADGVAGAMLSMPTAGVVAVDPKGQRLWDWSDPRSNGGKLDTFSAYPEHVLATGAQVTLVRARGSEVEAHALLSRDYFYAHQGVLVPTTEDGPAVIAAGELQGGAPLLRRFGPQAWEARLSAPIIGLARLLLPGDRIVVVGATSSGTLLAFTPDGTLLDETPLPPSRDLRRGFSLKAVRVAEGGPWILVRQGIFAADKGKATLFGLDLGRFAAALSGDGAAP